MIKHESFAQSNHSKNKLNETLVEHYSGKLIPVKLQFFIDIAEKLRPFLKRFQTDKPVLTFIEVPVQDMLLSLMKIFVKKDLLEVANTKYKLATVEINLSSNLILSDLIVSPTATKSLLKHLNLQAEKKRSFLKECLEMLKATVSKIQERCPLKYSTCINSSCLSPVKMIQNHEVVFKSSHL